MKPVAGALERLLNAAGEDGAREILREVGRRSAQDELERVIARRFALALLEARAPRSLIRDRLVSRGLNMRTAYRVIDAALSVGPRPDACEVGDAASCDTEGPPLSNPLRSIDASSMNGDAGADHGTEGSLRPEALG